MLLAAMATSGTRAGRVPLSAPHDGGQQPIELGPDQPLGRERARSASAIMDGNGPSV